MERMPEQSVRREKILIVPDSFKETLSAAEVCRIVSEEAEAVLGDAEIRCIPIADGGEGSVDCFLQALGGTRQSVQIKGPLFDDVDAQYGILPDGQTAVIEMAAAAGLPLTQGRQNPLLTTTFGVGQLIADAVQKGCRRILLGLGGSATNDGGCGMAAALGVRFYDADGEEMLPLGGTLGEIDRIDCSDLFLPPDIRVTALCDVTNPLYGEEGAAFVFAPQKGADAQMTVLLDEGLRHLGEIMERDCSAAVTDLPGAGAAGGMGAGAVAFLGARFASGIDAVLEAVDFDRALEGCTLVITGEGKVDAQSECGKAIGGIAARAKRKGVPVAVLTGNALGAEKSLYDAGVTAVFPIGRQPESFAQAALRIEENLRSTARDMLRFWAAARRKG